MIFRPELAAKVMAGEKTVTRRALSENPRSPWWKERCRYTVGKTFTVNPGRGKTGIGEARVTHCAQVLLGSLETSDAQREGFDTIAEFVDGWTRINGSFDTTERVWRIAFEVLQ